MKSLLKHAREFAKYMQKGQFEKTESGILFPAAKATIIGRGRYTHTVNGEDEQIDYNLLTNEGILYMLNAAFGSTAKESAFYVAPFQANATPLATWNGANYNTNATEVTSLTEGYSNATRPQWVPANATLGGGLINNLASRASFTIACTSNVTWYGAGLMSTNTRGDTVGKLLSAARFGSPRVLSNTDVWACGYEVDLEAA